MLAIRVRFKKEGRARYISHLDLNRVMQRALRRASIPIWRTQGFNPHPYLVFALPLSLFYESDCECMDARLDADMPFEEVRARLNAQMPDGITVTSVAPPRMKLTEIAYASYLTELDFGGLPAETLQQAVDALLQREELSVEKKTKRGSYPIDVLPYLKNGTVEVREGTVAVTAVLPAGTAQNLNPSCFAQAFEQYAFAPRFEQVRRLEIFNTDMEPFA